MFGADADDVEEIEDEDLEEEDLIQIVASEDFE